MRNNIPSQLQPYIPLVEFLGSVMGNQCEVVLHNVRNIENSIVAIKNGHISNRKIGGSLTDLALKILKNKSYVEKDYLINYSGKTQDGKIVRSSTYFIKDEIGNVVGMLCFNMDLSIMVETRNLLDSLINATHKVPSNGLDLNGKTPSDIGNPIEDLHTSIEDLTTSIILNTLSEANIPPDRMSADEKIEIVKQLNEKGVFLIKGAVSEVSVHLKTSEATVYRYLNKIDTKQQNDRVSTELPL
ncbi:transcriptional regulator [Neobacillus sp. NPDC093127]|uniref:helix-turn-helix transcriptional regulator n=1 Tax=Neobacillus sp. NPDC093127 TaxID=3364296 RepID=UPI00381B0811